MDATTEELQHLLAHQPRGLLYTRDELSGWLGNHDRYGGHGGDRAFFLEAWNGGAYVVDRRNHSGQPVRIARASVAMSGTSPDRLREALAGADDGLAARFCYVGRTLRLSARLPSKTTTRREIGASGSPVRRAYCGSSRWEPTTPATRHRTPCG